MNSNFARSKAIVNAAVTIPTTISKNVRHSNQCVICFNKFKINNTPPSVSQKMYKLCRKYVHSEIMKESLAAKWDLSTEHSMLQFCENCFESAVELNDLTEQLEFLQKSISELLVMFSMGILHRRSKSKVSSAEENLNSPSNHEPVSKNKKLVEVDVSGLTECDSWSCSPSLSLPKEESFMEIPVNVKVSCFSDSKTDQDYSDPLMENYIEIKHEAIDILDSDEDDPMGDPFDTEKDFFIPSVSLPTPKTQKTPIQTLKDNVTASSILKTCLLDPVPPKEEMPTLPAEVQPTEPEQFRNRRKSKLIPLNEIAEESSASSTTESVSKEQLNQRLYHLDPKSVQPGQDRRRVQKALNCYKYRLKKKQEAEQTIGTLNSEVENLRMQLRAMKQQQQLQQYGITTRNSKKMLLRQ